MENRQVLTVFSSIEMIHFFLLITKKAEEYYFRNCFQEKGNTNYEQFLKSIKGSETEKTAVRNMLLLAIANIDWEENYYQAVARKFDLFDSV